MGRQCDYVVPIENVLTDSDNICVITKPEFVDGPSGDLYEYQYGNWSKIRRLEKKSEQDIRKICWEIGMGIAHLHRVGVVHRNIKLESIKLGVDGVARLDRYVYFYPKPARFLSKILLKPLKQIYVIS